MSDITMVGLGAMGTALAQALVKGGRDVTVWNRSPQKIAPVVAIGASGAPSLAEALRASHKVMICINDYNTTSMLLDQPELTPLLQGRTVVQLSTGTPREASDSNDWFRAHDATYLDGAITVYPDTIGTDQAQILLAGPKAVFESCKSFLQCLAGDLRYLGPNIRAASALDLAFLSRLMGVVFGTIHGAHLCESEGIDPSYLADLLPAGDRGETLARVIHDGAFEVGGMGATVEVTSGTLARLQDQAHDAGINSEFPDFLMSLVKRAKAAGYGGQETAVVIKVLRDAKHAG